MKTDSTVEAIEKTSPLVDAAAIALALAHNGNQVHLQGAEPAKQAKKAKAEVAKPTQTESSLMDEILRAGDALNGEKVAEAIQTAHQILTNASAVAVFANAIISADDLAMQKLGFDRDAGKAQAKWYTLTLVELEKQLRCWAENGDQVAGALLKPLAMFEKSKADVTQQLWRLMTEIIRPTRGVRSYYDLSQLLKKLVDMGLVERLARNCYPEKAVVLGVLQHSTGYLPSMERGMVIPMAEAAWPWIKKAEAQAKQWTENKHKRLVELHSQDTGMTPVEAENGREGKVFLQVGPNSGALLLIGRRRIRFEEIVGLKLSGPARGTLNWNAGQNYWPNDDLYYAFEAWKKSSPPSDPTPAPDDTSAQPAK